MPTAAVSILLAEIFLVACVVITCESVDKLNEIKAKTADNALALRALNARILRPRSTNPECPQCATNRTGKLSCCVRGGSWFKKCGNPDSNSEHTWDEGILACEGKSKSTSGYRRVPLE